MKIVVTEPPRVIMTKMRGLHRYFAWPTVCRLQDGRIAVVCSGERLWHICPFGKAVISYSTDEGETYTPPGPVIDTALDDRDAGICTFGKKGLLVTSFNNSIAFQSRFSDKNYTQYRNAYLDTITPEIEARDIGSNFRISLDGGVTFGEIYKCPVTSPHGPIALKDGTILWVGRLHRGHHDYTPEDDFCEVYRIGLDGSCTFVGRLPDIYDGGEKLTSCEPNMIELDNGNLLCHIRVQSDKPNPDGMSASVFTVYQTISKDGCKTWTTPVRILPMRGGAPSHLLMHSSGMIIATYGYREGPYGIKVIFSRDDGETWSKGHWLDDSVANSDCGYPSTVELNDGSLLTVYYAPTDEGICAVWQVKWRFEE